jgi:hypothetical protein
MTWTRTLLAALCLAALGTPAAGKQVTDTARTEPEGDTYTFTYDSTCARQGGRDPVTIYQLVYDLGDTVLAIMGDTAKWDGTVTLSRLYFADVSNDCDWVTDTYTATFRKGKAHGTWRHVERYCKKVWIDQSAVYTDGVRTAGERLSTPAY